jgi:hypothetical protein
MRRGEAPSASAVGRTVVRLSNSGTEEMVTIAGVMPGHQINPTDSSRYVVYCKG